MGDLLNKINSPGDLKRMSSDELIRLAAELREEIISVVSKSGGHLAPSLGVIELTIALHYILHTPNDSIVWDVGHQAYAHKLLTGRRQRFDTLRQYGGLSGFPNKYESPYDLFTVGHASNAISNAIGLAVARDLRGGREKVVAVVGDASLAGGMSFEAMNFAGHIKNDLIVILNDNEHSISKSVGALSGYLNRITTSPIYNNVRKDVERLLRRIPRLGFRLVKAAQKLEESLKNLLVPGILFEELGFRYVGPIDGHDISNIIATLKNIINMNEPVLVHVITKKGKGYTHAQERPDKFHGTGAFDIETGERLDSAGATFTGALSDAIIEVAGNNEKVVAITAAMPEGTGLDKFAQKFPKRFFDVGIAEGHAVGFAAGLARGGYIPVVAIYSTFLQRGYDQIIHDVCLQNLPVIFAIDRAGLVGEDGPTHHGLFDIAYLRHIPNMVVMAPADTDELKTMVEFAVSHNGPVAIRYPRGKTAIVHPAYAEASAGRQLQVKLGKAEVLKDGSDIAIVSIGSMVGPSIQAARELAKEGIDAAVINARFAKPLDENMLEDLAKRTGHIITVEEGSLEGGFGAAVLEFFEEKKIKNISVRRIGLPPKFIEHGKRELLFDIYKLNASGIKSACLEEVRKK